MNIPGRDATPAPARLSHDAAEALISARLDGPLDPTANRSLLAHLATCPSCRAFAEQMSGMSRGLRDMPHLPPSPAVSRQVRERLQAGQPWWSRLSMGTGERFGAMQAAAALLILVGAVATVLIVQMVGRENGKGTITSPTTTALTQVSPDASPSVTRTPGDAASLTPRATRTQRPDPTQTVINVQITIPPATETIAPVEEPSATATEEPQPTATDEPSETPTDEPTATPTEKPTRTPRPTRTPTDEPTATETEQPTETPTDEPTATPTDEPTETPTDEPTAIPTDEPTETPTEEPTRRPTRTATATEEPTETVEPTLTGTPPILPRTPTDGQGGDTSSQETDEPTEIPTDEPSEEPTAEPTDEPATEEPAADTPTPPIKPRGTQEAGAEPTTTPETAAITSVGDGNGSGGSDGNRSGGGDSDGNGTDGNNSEGNTSGGDNSDGNSSDGNQSVGNETDGNRSSGNETDGNSTGGEVQSSYEQADVLGEFPQANGATTGLNFSTRGLFVYSDGGSIAIGDADGGPVASFPGSNPVWSPQGGVLLYQAGDELAIWDADTFQISSITAQTQGDEAVYDIAAGWNGPQLLYIRRFPNDPGRAEFHTADWNGANDSILWDGQLSDILAQPVATTEGVWVLTSDGWVQLFYEGGAGDPRSNPWGSIGDPVASPFGSVFAFVTGDGQLIVVTASNPEVQFTPPIPDGGAGFAFAPDGESIVVANGNGLTTYDMRSGSQTGHLDGEAVAAPGWGEAGIYAVTQGQVPTLIRLPTDAVFS